MAVIHVLDKHTAELIAAGEVVERPASVVEGAAGKLHRRRCRRRSPSASSPGGVKLIEISDNGTGI